MSNSATPIAWTIAGSDSGAGAGIQADIKTMQSFSVYCCSVVTAVTAQNTHGVLGIESVSPALVRLQLRALKEDLKPSSIKIGMLHSLETVEAVASELNGLGALCVYDPVMFATSGDALMEDSALSAIRLKLLPVTTLLTPNWAEAHYLTGRAYVEPSSFSEQELPEYIEALAFDLLQMGPNSILLKGGHTGGQFSQDYWTDGASKLWLTSPRQNSSQTHGTGCTLSAGIAAGLANGENIIESIVTAKAYVNRGIRMAPNVGSMSGPVAHLDLDFAQDDLPWITKSAMDGQDRQHFEPDESIGFYPVVPNCEWVIKLAKYGVKTIQLRIKDMVGVQLESEIARAVEASKFYGCNLYINDYWALAVKHGAYGVHLGQEDLKEMERTKADGNIPSNNIDTIRSAGLRLGISTHCYEEVARAIALQPSYMAIGPIYPTTTKQMRFAPQGLSGFKRWRKCSKLPLVAIGGITLDRAAELVDSGANGVAVVRDILDHPEPEAHSQKWLLLWNGDQRRRFGGDRLAYC
ncbi:MAG: bifunctional hydroxymethylpyrimidine kinase/phosphomethylpyrimidine kinase [Candidatus Melainabacteria bacterium]|nr:bifunctional hydroxymethylpyrimidine kinase/phosphomethylpyrimidine kinase [Candidatus Melainabacteria bacterium]